MEVMMKRYKNKIKGFHKKSILPSAFLFIVYIAFCLLVILIFTGIFIMYIMDSKARSVNSAAEDMGRLVNTHTEDGDIPEVARYISGYLGNDKDICVTDNNFNVLFYNGKEELPDFHNNNALVMEFFNSYRLFPAQEFERRGLEDGVLSLDIMDLWERTIKVLPEDRGEGWDQWMDQEIYSASYWTEVPVKTKEYNVYYKGRLVLWRKDIIYVILAGGVALALLVVPIILMFINLVSSILMQKRMVRLLYLDTVTGGRNWLYFVQQSHKVLSRFWNTHNTYAIIDLHMNHYQDYCACYGNRAGEELLENIDGFLQAKTSRTEVFARFAKADFGLMLRCASQEECEKRLRKMLAELTGIKRDRKLSYYAGIYMLLPASDSKKSSICLRRNLDTSQLYNYANAARETLRKLDGEYIKVFDQQILEEQLWKRKVEDSMEAALANNEFHVYLQPKYNPVSGKIAGAEALARWVSPVDGIIPPSRFIPVFEENGFITRLDDYMVSSVAKLQSEWKIKGRKPVPVSVNISRANFTKRDLAEHICHLVDSYGADHALIELEVTESAFFGDKDMLKNIIEELKIYGFNISMDDFGAGYSSLNSLKDLPIDVLKLDMEFFKGEDKDGRGKIVVKEAIRLAKNLDMKVVAEGIEKKEQVEFLAGQGCDMIQGFYYAEPMPVCEFDKKIEQEPAE